MSIGRRYYIIDIEQYLNVNAVGIGLVSTLITCYILGLLSCWRLPLLPTLQRQENK